MPDISKRARDTIIGFEVSSEENYNARLQRLIWPGGMSGITGAIGHDFGYSHIAEIADDWGDLLPIQTTARLTRLAGRIGLDAAGILAQYADIRIPYEAAIHVFEYRTLPRTIAQTLAAFPLSEGLSPDSLGALVSLVYNRGTSVVGPTRTEMLAIRDAIAVGAYVKVPKLMRQMCRVWENPDGTIIETFKGLIARRLEEAWLFDFGLDSDTTELFSPSRPPIPGSLEANALDAQVAEAEQAIEKRPSV